MLRDLVAELKAKIETCDNSDDLYGKEWDISDLSGRAMDRLIFLEESLEGKEPVATGNFEEILKQIDIAIDGCDDIEECRKAVDDLQKLSRRLVQKMGELGPPT